MGGGEQGEGTKVKVTKTSGGGRVNTSLSHNPPRDCNISSFFLNL